MEITKVLKTIDYEIKNLKEKKQHIKWLVKVHKTHNDLINKNKDLHLVFFDNDNLPDNLPFNTKTITFLYYKKNKDMETKTKLNNLPLSLEKIIILETFLDLDEIKNDLRLPFGCEILIIDEYNNNIIEFGTQQKTLYKYYNDILKINPSTKLFTIKKILGNEKIINIQIDIFDGKKIIQTTSDEFCSFIDYYRDNKNVFKDLIF